MTEIFDLNARNDIVLVSISSTAILPSKSVNLRSPRRRDDFPAPVRPTMPIFSLGSTVNDTPFKADAEFSEYLK